MTAAHRAALLALGPVLFAAGLWATPALEAVLRRPLRMTAVLLVVPWLLAWGAARLARIRVATMLAIGWGAALVVFAGPLPVAATVLLALGALAAGDVVRPAASVAEKAAVGLVAIAGIIGWALPWPVHHAAVYGSALFVLVAWRRHALAAMLRALPAGWRATVADAPRAAAWAVATLGVASTAAWLPTMQYDDVAYHLGLPSQLQQLGHYRFDASSQVWALAPWAGDVLHAVVQVLAGGEARGALNALWLVLLSMLVHRLAQAVGAGAAGAFAAIALAASTPTLLWLLGGMQAELPSAVLLLAIATTIATLPRRRPADDPEATTPPGHADVDAARRTWIIALAAAGLMALKASNALLAAPLAVWWLWQARGRLPWRHVAVAAPVAAGIGGASYAYAAWLAGNPFLPLFNDRFPNVFATGSRMDTRWATGVGLDLPWRIAFETDRYVEAYPGGAGFLLVLMAGALLAALAHGRTRALALAGLAAWLLPLLVVQYARYATPALFLLAPAAAAGARRLGERPGLALVALCWAAQMAFFANGSWHWRAGAPKYLLDPSEGAPGLLSRLQPERRFEPLLRDDRTARILATGPEPTHAAWGGRGFTTHVQDPTLHAAALAADTDGSPAAWRRFLRTHGFTHVTLRDGSPDSLRRALPALGARRLETAGDAELWRLPESANRRDLMHERDYSRNIRGN